MVGTLNCAGSPHAEKCYVLRSQILDNLRQLSDITFNVYKDATDFILEASMAGYNTYRTATAGVRTAQVDEGLRAHMNKVYATMSVGMLITFAVAWAVGTSPALL